MRSGRKTKEACLDRQTLADPDRSGTGRRRMPSLPDMTGESVSIATAVAPGPPFGQAAVVSPSIQRAPKPGRSAVVLGLSPTGLYAMRELAAAGYGVLGVSDELAPGLWSRRATLGTWRTSSPDRLVDRLRGVRPGPARAAGPRSRRPTRTSSWSSPTRRSCPASDSSRRTPTASRPTSSTRSASTRCATATACTSLAGRSSMTETRRVRLIEGSADPVPFPAILKPSEIHRVKHILRGRKVIIVRDRSELLAALRDLPFESTSWLLQEVVPGPESELRRAGRLHRPGRTGGPDGDRTQASAVSDRLRVDVAGADGGDRRCPDDRPRLPRGHRVQGHRPCRIQA